MMVDSYSIRGHILTPSSSSDTSSSSTRSSHLSVLTSSSSASSDMQVASPLPSPSFPLTSSVSKTHAFFSSSFADDSPTPVPPPNPPSRSASLRSDTSAARAEETPKIDPQTPPRSLNADFFASSRAARPTPPPSIRSLTASSSAASPENSPPASPPARVLPPLSRFFPSRARYATIDSLPSREPSASTRRGFVDVEDTPSHHELEQPPTPALTTSPSALPTPLPTHFNTPAQSETPVTLKARDIVSDGSKLSLELVRTLGQGAFSSVWLAKDVNQQLPALELTRKSSLIRSRSLNRGRRKRLEGTNSYIRNRRMKEDVGAVKDEPNVHLSDESVGSGRPNLEDGRLIAVKMTDRRICETNDRSRVSFVREVEVLRHISHPSIVSYLHSFSTPSHHCLVLEQVGGGELFDLIDSAESHAKLDEPLLRRMFGELCKAVGWMHGVGLVHRDIKLENILLTVTPFTTHPLPAAPHPLIKLTDFGLSRFIDPAQPLLTTRCGSESYAAPELVTGRPYDGRETDAWSCGVVLYALVTRRLPFDKARVDERNPREVPQGQAQVRGKERSDRRALLVRIAKGEYAWPEEALVEGWEEAEVRGEMLARREGVRRVVGKLLVRDPNRRSKIIELWEDEWMKGEGAPLPPPPPPHDLPAFSGEVLPDSPKALEYPAAGTEDTETALDDEDDGDGVLVDGDDIGPEHVACQEH